MTVAPSVVLLLAAKGMAAGAASCSPQSVDFANHSFTLPNPTPNVPPRFGVVSGQSGGPYVLRKGHYRAPQREMEGKFTYVELLRVEYGDVTGDGSVDAIVSLDASMGGTQHWGFIAAFSCENQLNRPIGLFSAGDRAHEGLRKAFARGGLLVIELNDPAKSTADCCSSGIVRYKFKWSRGRFVQVSKPEFEDLVSGSR